MKVFVTGGSGFLGSRLVPRLVNEGHQVTGLALTSSDERILHAAGASSRRGDLSSPGALKGMLEGHDAVVHAAALLDHFGSRARFQAINVEGTRALLGAAKRAGIKRFVYVSAGSVVLSMAPTVGDEEDLPVIGANFCGYSSSKAEAERLVLTADAPGFSTIALRPPMIWGAGDKAMLPAIVDAVRTGRFALVDKGSFRTSTCHVANVAEAIAKALASDAHGKALFLTDGPPRLNREVLSDLLETQGVRLGDKTTPRWVMIALGFVLEKVWRFLPLRSHPPLTRSLVMLTSIDFALNDARARRMIGYASETSWEQGLEELRQAAQIKPAT
jgi:nucleoside-diphosphate-sugar epimerase